MQQVHPSAFNCTNVLIINSLLRVEAAIHMTWYKNLQIHYQADDPAAALKPSFYFSM